MKISVIIPLYNQKKFINQAIDSILQQTHQNIEIIVINDGSTDNPYPELDKYKAAIILVEQQNSGLSAARNRGLNYATGDYIQFLDADDFLHSEKLELQLKFMKKNGSKISYCEVFQLEEKTGKQHLRYIGPVNDIFKNLYNVWLPYPLPIHSLLFKKDVFDTYGHFPIDLKAAEDRFFLSNLALAGESFDYYPFIGGARRLHCDNMNLNRTHIYVNMIEYYRRINKNGKASLYFKQNYRFTPKEMMNANLTYMFFMDLANGTSWQNLIKVLKIFFSHKIRFLFNPIPGKHTFLIPVTTLARRWLAFFKKLIF